MKYEFTGWVEKVFPAGKYDREIIVRDKQSTTEEYISFITFNVRSKNDAEVENLQIDTKVKIEFFLNGVMGVSNVSNKPYHINKLTLNKIEVLEVPASTVPSPAPAPNDDVGESQKDDDPPILMSQTNKGE